MSNCSSVAAISVASLFILIHTVLYPVFYSTMEENTKHPKLASFGKFDQDSKDYLYSNYEAWKRVKQEARLAYDRTQSESNAKALRDAQSQYYRFVLLICELNEREKLSSNPDNENAYKELCKLQQDKTITNKNAKYKDRMALLIGFTFYIGEATDCCFIPFATVWNKGYGTISTDAESTVNGPNDLVVRADDIEQLHKLVMVSLPRGPKPNDDSMENEGVTEE